MRELPRFWRYFFQAAAAAAAAVKVAGSVLIEQLSKFFYLHCNDDTVANGQMSKRMSESKTDRSGRTNITLTSPISLKERRKEKRFQWKREDS